MRVFARSSYGRRMDVLLHVLGNEPLDMLLC